MMLKRPSFIKAFAVVAVLSLVSACGLGGTKPDDPRTVNPTDIRKTGTGGGKVFGDDAFVFGGNSKAKDAVASGGGGIGVNSFLWRASLDTVVFMPVTSADPFGGVILTDWYTPDGAPSDERFKLNVYILDRALRADALRVALFRQTLDQGTWRDAPVANGAATKIEDAILMKARQLRNETLEQ